MGFKIDNLEYRIEKRGGIDVLIMNEGCSPANIAEIYFWNIIKELLEKDVVYIKLDDVIDELSGIMDCFNEEKIKGLIKKLKEQ